ncbi:MAG TPA: hypothetical protein PLV06_01300 [Bacteroidales bacterium]|nr:hypothetical protein [Bacteroidales bacterium]HPJ58839.1 hypothetical protein [Bacteroidales bacterium]HPR10995.1 hypothetical protein [Bacteroidales bacterium]HRW84479.1 hypothetical protein [Bacteroidales bacterium]
MWSCSRIYHFPPGSVVILALSFIITPSYSQEKVKNDSLPHSKPFPALSLPVCSSLELQSEGLKLQESLIPLAILPERRNYVFYDSLASRASRFILTKKLYDLVVIREKTVAQTNAANPSLSDFSPYSGMIIREITVKRLDVFGTSITNPLLYNPTKAESLLNKTHLNTNEFIIRNNLLFSVGDTLSPLLISDNERHLRDLPFIDDSRIIVLPAGDNKADVLVLTRDVYSLGAGFDYRSIGKGCFSLFDKNILGLGHEFRLDVPYDNDLPVSPGFGIEYNINNIRRSFVNMNLFYFNGLGENSYGFSADRKLVSSTTKYAGGISVIHMSSTEDLDTMSVPEPLKYNLQDYWLSRSFLLSRKSVSRLIFGIRYTNNNVFDHPYIMPDSYHYLQKYKMFLGSVTFSIQKYFKTNLLYGYGRTEDIPYGGLITITAGKEFNEFKERTYAGLFASTGHSVRPLGYFYTSAGFSSFVNEGQTEQGLLLLRTTYFSNLMYLGRLRMRNFVIADYTRGFDRNTEERLNYSRFNGFSGFRNDSVSGTQRLSLSLETVLFTPRNILGFRLSVFAFSDLAFLFGTNEILKNGEALSSVGIGIRARNDNLVFKTLQIRFSFFPVLPDFSKVNYILFSGEQLLKPDNFDPGPPGLIPYR